MIKKVYIIDDDPIYTFSMKYMLKQLGFLDEPVVFENGEEALRGMLNISPEDLPGLVLLDINMPVLDGWGFLDGLPDNEVIRGLRIFMVTSSISQDDRNRASNYAKLSGYLVKPVAPERLKEILEA